MRRVLASLVVVAALAGGHGLTQVYVARRHQLSTEWVEIKGTPLRGASRDRRRPGKERRVLRRTP